jgi:intracellular sulfur oxidation DsrE/DsrF family protein
LDFTDQAGGEAAQNAIDRRSLLKVTGGALAAAAIYAAAPIASNEVAEAFVPNNFHACIHITREDDFQYAFSALQTISEQYKKATGRLIVDGGAVKSLTSDDMIASLKSANDKGAEIKAASDALAINGVDPTSLPDFIDAKNPGVIAVVDAQVKGFHYYKL